MGSKRWLPLALVVVVYGCSSPFGPDEVRALASARERWAGRAFADYIFDTRHGCFCPPELVGPVRVTVRQGAIVGATLLETGEATTPGNWYTIDQLFELIPTFAEEEGVDDVAVEYDPTFGYPASVEVRFEEGILDAGSSYTVTALGPAP